MSNNNFIETFKTTLMERNKLDSRVAIFDHKLAQPPLSLSTHFILIVLSKLHFSEQFYLLLFTKVCNHLNLHQLQRGNTESYKNIWQYECQYLNIQSLITNFQDLYF
jgi:hypothetical protein